MTPGRKSLSIFTELICNLILYINTGSDKNRINSTPLTQRDWFPHQLSQCSTQKAGVNPLKQKLSRPAIVSGIKYLNMKSAEKKLKLAPLVLCIGAAGRESGAETHVWYTHCRTRWAKRTRRRTRSAYWISAEHWVICVRALLLFALRKQRGGAGGRV